MITIQQKIADIYSMEQLAQVYRTEAELTRSYGKHALAFFGLAPGEEGLVNYRLVRNVAVVLGDPVCAPEAFERVTGSFLSGGAQIVSLGMVAMADTRQEMAPVERRLASFVIDRLHLLEDRRTLFNFKQKFHPQWESRYVVTNTTLALPKIVLAVLRLRSYYSGGKLARLLTRLINRPRP